MSLVLQYFLKSMHMVRTLYAARGFGNICTNTAQVYITNTEIFSYEVSQSDTMYGYTHHMNLLKDDYNW